MRCPLCRRALAHCHGTLVLHADGSQECLLRADCGGGVAMHELVIECVELTPRCRCTG